MLKLSEIQGKHKTEEITINVKSWGGDVRIRQLTVAESAEIIEMENSPASMVKAVSFSLVEPKMSEEEINSLEQDAFSGVNEILKAISGIEPKK